MRFAPVMPEEWVLAWNSCSCSRSDAPAQWTVVPPTVLQIHAGRFGKSFAMRQVPDVVRLSSHASWLNANHSSLRNVAGDWRCPASSRTTFRPLRQSSLASVPPPAPEPTISTTESSLASYRGMIRVLHQAGFGLADSGGFGSHARSSKPRWIYPPYL